MTTFNLLESTDDRSVAVGNTIRFIAAVAVTRVLAAIASTTPSARPADVQQTVELEETQLGIFQRLEEV